MQKKNKEGTYPWEEQSREVIEKEWERIHCRRVRAWLDSGDETSVPKESDLSQRPEEMVGLGLSGGGIRSATFNLGLLQALHHFGLLKKMDYLSTVSGGGYIGACLTWFGSVLGQDFPFDWRNQNLPGQRERARKWLHHLRAHGSYLVPGDGLNLWALAAAILAGSLTTLIVLVPVFLACIAFMSELVMGRSLFAWLRLLGLMLLFSFAMGVLVYSVSTNMAWLRKAAVLRSVRILLGGMLQLSLLLLVAGSIPIVYAAIYVYAPEWKGLILSGISLSGAASFAAGLIGSKGGEELKPGRSVLLSMGLLLFIYAIFLWFFHLEGLPGLQLTWLPLALVLSVLVALLANINHVSMHRFYRNRLRETYMPSVGEEDGPDPDQCLLYEIEQTAFPYQIINANLQTVGSDDPHLRQRGGGNFIFSPAFCGSDATGYIASSDYLNGRMNLATAMAISGAAADTNSYATRSKPVVFLMTLFNVRLGYWIRNPRKEIEGEGPRRFIRPMWYWYLIRELFGNGLDEYAWDIRLSDGGHFENLALYELVRRRCSLIIISDASKDPGYTFADFGRAVERVRADFGAQVEIDLSPLRPGTDGVSPQACIQGTINYGPDSLGRKQKSTIIYVKSVYLAGLPPDVVAYRNQHRDFPDQSTGDQFFAEDQFEAYRELGFQVGRELVSLLR